METYLLGKNMGPEISQRDFKPSSIIIVNHLDSNQGRWTDSFGLGRWSRHGGDDDVGKPGGTEGKVGQMLMGTPLARDAPRNRPGRNNNIPQAVENDGETDEKKRRMKKKMKKGDECGKGREERDGRRD